MHDVSVQPVKTRRDSRDFLMLPYRLHRGHPQWVPPPIMDQKSLLDRHHHPFYLKARAEFFLARQGGEVCGRVAAIHNAAHNEFHQDSTGFFGFFETVDSPQVAHALLDTASSWLRERGLSTIRGPVNPSTNYECAFLVDGFDSPPVFMMPYNPPHYPALVEEAGFAKAKDLLAYRLQAETVSIEKLTSLVDRLLKRENVRNRTIKMEKLAEEIACIIGVYNDAWSRNWGFIPMSPEEIRHMASNLKWVCDPRIIFITEKDGEPVGLLLAMPDLNVVFKGLGGRIFPFGWVKLLRERRKIKRMRVLAMGFRKSSQNLGFAALCYRDIVQLGQRAGYTEAEISWVLEDNVLMNRAAVMLGSVVYKRYRVYERPL